jgi:hypothetical protein
LTGEWSGTISGNVSTMSHNFVPFESSNSATTSNSTDLTITFDAGGLPPNLPANLPLQSAAILGGGGLPYFPPSKFGVGETESRTITNSTSTTTFMGSTTTSTITSTTTFTVSNATTAPDHFFVAYDVISVSTSSFGSPVMTTTYTTTGTLSFDALVTGNTLAVTVQFTTNTQPPTSNGGPPPAPSTGSSSGVLMGTLTRG